MKRLALNLFAFVVIVSGGTYLAAPAEADDSLQATCGSCSGVCCGWSGGECWARDRDCPPVKATELVQDTEE